MHYVDFIKKTFKLKGFNIKNIEYGKKTLKRENNYIDKDIINIDVEMPVKEQICPRCGHKTSHIHDYYNQSIKSIPIGNMFTYINYKKRRYQCDQCKKNFYEDNSLIVHYQRRTIELTDYIVNELRSLTSIQKISKDTNVSTSVINRLLSCFAITNTQLPKVLCIDEFKGNIGYEKYQVVLLNGETHEIVDIIKDRTSYTLSDYFSKFPKEELNNVKYLVGDLWPAYKTLASTFFKNATYIADRFHCVSLMNNALDKIRIQVQKKLPKSEHKYFRNSRFLLLSKRDKLTEKESEELDYILYNYSEDLRRIYNEKEELLDIMHSKEAYGIKVNRISEWIKSNSNSSIKGLKETSTTYRRWLPEIKASLKESYSNGPTEGVNNKIKTLKRISFGMRNFNNFKARILLLDLK